MKTLMELGPNECHFPVGDELPVQNALVANRPYAKHLMCGAPTDGSTTKAPYCDEHRARSSGGIGKDWQGLAGMIEAMEQTIQKASKGNEYVEEEVSPQELVEVVGFMSLRG